MILGYYVRSEGLRLGKLARYMDGIDMVVVLFHFADPVPSCGDMDVLFLPVSPAHIMKTTDMGDAIGGGRQPPSKIR